MLTGLPKFINMDFPHSISVMIVDAYDDLNDILGTSRFIKNILNQQKNMYYLNTISNFEYLFYVWIIFINSSLYLTVNHSTYGSTSKGIKNSVNISV